MPNIFLKHPGKLDHTTSIERTRPASVGSVWVALSENIVRPEGGGQPRDHAMIASAAGRFGVADVRKEDGATWLLLQAAPDLATGEMVFVEVDAARRAKLSRAHSLTHVLMASFRQTTRGFESRGASISEAGEAVRIWFKAAQPSQDVIRAAEALAANTIQAGPPIEIIQAKSLQHARSMFPNLRVDPGLELSGRIRVVHISGFDANPCSGSHVADAAQVGGFVITGVTAGPDTVLVEARPAQP